MANGCCAFRAEGPGAGPLSVKRINDTDSESHLTCGISQTALRRVLSDILCGRQSEQQVNRLTCSRTPQNLHYADTHDAFFPREQHFLTPESLSWENAH